MPAVINFSPDGSVDFTRGEPDKLGLDLGKPVAQSMVRITEIRMLFDGYAIEWLRGPLAAQAGTQDDQPNLALSDLRIHTFLFGRSKPVEPVRILEGERYRDTLLFDTYADAVAYEIRAVDSLRKRGHTFA